MRDDPEDPEHDVISRLEEMKSRAESKEKRGENSDFWFLGRTVRADIFGWIYLGSKKFSQMAAFVGKSKNIESSLNLNNYCQISIQLAGLTKLNDE